MSLDAQAGRYRHLGDGSLWGQVDDRESLATLNRAIDLGVNLFDTADVYGSEPLLGQLRKQRGQPFYIATKMGMQVNPEARGYNRKNTQRERLSMLTTQSFTDLIRQRYSVRIYQATPIAPATQAELQARLDLIREGPLGTPVRLKLAAAAPGDSQSLRGLGTYGLIKHPTGFIVGAARASEHFLEDFGYTMEQAILEATALGLGTCWLGGNFTQSSFGKRIDKAADEIVPAVSVVGYADPSSRRRDRLRQKARSDQRLPWESLFFDGQFGASLTPQSAGDYAEALEMLRLAPSASNKQPWRVIRDGSRWHFYCQRTPGYGKGSLIFTLLRIADLQRLDTGIAMCHFELTARRQGLTGAWVCADPGLAPVDQNTLYITSWMEK